MRPLVLRAEHAVRAGRWPDTEVIPTSESPGPRLTTKRWRMSRRAIERVLKLWRTRAEEFELVAALAGHDVMRRHGLPARIECVPGPAGEADRARLWLGERVVRFAATASDDDAPAGGTGVGSSRGR